ncbi:NnrU family protein [Novosphingobium sp. FKTRR1]|uniref:NnrU family protein n=1 Tax=Novosphingobium sp. FKTRR1 TaxID=2879118 RepID=UPI001CF084B4
MDLVQLGIAASLFLASHFILSHPLRASLVRSLGAEAFLVVYSLIALVSFSWLMLCYGRVPAGVPLWDGHAPLPWAAASVLTVVALGLFLASLYRNPALAGAKLSGLETVLPYGVFRITRHPMMFAIAIWAFSHILIAPTGRGFVLMGTMILLALVGSHLQDRKKRALDGKNWRAWMKRTPFWPDVRQFGQIGALWGVALGLWVLITWAHIPLAGEPAGIWILRQSHLG